MKSDLVLNVKRNKAGGVVLLGVSAGALAVESPVFAQTSGGTTSNSNIDNVSSMITSLGGIAAAVTVVVLGAMGVRMAIKLVNRVGVKG